MVRLIFNKPPPQNIDFFINRRQFIGADTVSSFSYVYYPKENAITFI